MKKGNLLLGVVLGGLLMLPSVVWSQGNCPNLDFSYGNLINWRCYTGWSNPYLVTTTGPIPGRHTIMDAKALQAKGEFYDEQCPLIPKVPDGYNYSCKIGNDSAAKKATGIEYEMRVDSKNSLLLLSYAYVLSSAGHNLAENPQFTMVIRDSAGKLISGLPCNPVHFQAVNPSGLACETRDIIAQDWTTIAVSLEPLIGRKIKIYFEVWDCTLGGHFGYAYVVAECRPLQIELQYCAGQKVARLSAPDGFKSYEWTRSALPSWRSYDKKINVVSPMDGEIFTLTAKNALGCTSQLKIVIEETRIDAQFMYGVNGSYPSYQNWYDTCTRTATFVDFSKVYNNKKDRITWEIMGLPVFSHDSMWTYTFPDPPVPTKYWVKLTVIAENGCADTSKSQNNYITIYPSSRVKISGTTQICDGKQENLIATTIRSKFVEHNWTWRKTNGSTGSAKGDTLLIDMRGIYCLQSLDTNGCYAYDTLIVTGLKPIFNNLKITDVDCWGNATGQFQHGSITGGTGVFDTARWTIWDNVNKVFIDSSIITKTGGIVIFKEQIAGKYIFYGVDSESCEITDTIVIKQPDSLYISAIPKAATCLKNNGEIAFEVVGGVSPYNTSIGTVQTNKAKGIIANLPADVYFARVEDKNNCLAFDTLIVAETPMTLLSSIFLTKNAVRINLNQDTLLTVIFNPKNACNQDVVWISRDASIATVDAKGKVRGISYGETYIIVTSDDGGFQDTCKVTVTNVGINNYELQKANYVIYPNPTTGKLKIENGELKMGNVELYDICGKKHVSIFNFQFSIDEIDISHLANGMYFLKIENKIVKVIKQ